MFCIVVSKKDIASMNIGEELERLKPKFQVLEIEEDSVKADNVDKKTNAEVIIFATRHKAESGQKTFSIHAPGNWKKARYGGKEGRICKTSAIVLKKLYLELKKNAQNSIYDVTMECTHHGPLIERPCLFVEIGSTEQQWKDKEAARIIAKTLYDFIKEYKQEKAEYKVAIGMGGPHYCPNFNKVQERTDIAVGHVIPKYVLPLTEEMIKEALDKTVEKVDFFLLDWKGLGDEVSRKQLFGILQKFNLLIKRTDQI